MSEIVNFFRDYWQYISVGLVVILEIVSMIIKKKPINKFVDEFYGELVSLIEAAELNFTKGSEKKKYVLSSFLAHHPNYDLVKVSDAIEDILSTPQKKEVK